MKPRIVCIIPARLKATRFPRKMLSSLLGKPLLQWVWESAKAIPLFDAVHIAVDAVETKELVESFGASCLMTSPECLSGTDRLSEVALQGLEEADIWVNWQGDEPFIGPQVIEDLLQTIDESQTDIWTLKTQIRSEEEIQSPHFAKVVCDSEGYALYFSRSPIPYYRDGKIGPLYKHIGLYAYTTKALKKINTFPPSSLEMAEQLEQLRYLHYGMKVRVHETTSFDGFGIDLPEHLAKAEQYILQQL